MKKALIVASVASMIDQFNMENIKLLQKMGYTVHVACNFLEGSTFSGARMLQFKKELENMNISYYQIDFSRKGTDLLKHLLAYKQLKIVLEEEFDLIHFHSPIGGAVGRLSARKHREEGTKIIYTAHGFHFYQGAPLINWLLYYPVEKWLSGHTDTLITINQEDYSRAKKFKNTETVYIPGIGINVEGIKNVKIDRDRKREKLGIPKELFLMTSVGELNENKNHEIIIRALGKLKNNNIHYLICGEGHLKERLIELTVELGLAGQVHLLDFRQDVHEINFASDLFVFPSYREGLPVALMEAMAAGLPVVASNIRGNEDLIEKKGGDLLSPEKIEDWSKSILKIYKEPFKVKSIMGLYNQEKVKEYDTKNIVEKMQVIYNNKQ